jgi:hypothetical protein
MIYETDTNRVLVYDNTAWVMIADTDTPPGLELVKVQAVGTSVSSVEVTSAFSATWDTYFVAYSGGILSADTHIACQIGNATSTYYGAFMYGQYSTTTVAGANDNNAVRFNFVGGGDQYNGASCMFTVNNPFLTKQTYIHGISAYSTPAGTYTGRLANANSYSSFTLIPNTGTMTGGTIRVYGYRNTI